MSVDGGVEPARRNPHEVDVRWFRVGIVVGAVFLFVSLVLYEDPTGNDGIFGPLDPYNVRHKSWVEPLLASDWAAFFNSVAALGYCLCALGLQGRIRWRGVLTVFFIAAGLATVAIGMLVYLMVTDPATFPLGNGGMARVFLGHAIDGGGTVLMWWRLRRAVLA